jgi:hypothetical protein
LKISIPKLLFETPIPSVQPFYYVWDVAPDGKRFLILKATAAENGPQSPITVVMNWPGLLKK